jgi:hypothetical protein
MTPSPDGDLATGRRKPAENIVSALLGVAPAGAAAALAAASGGLAHVTPTFGNDAAPIHECLMPRVLGVDLSQLVDGGCAHETLRDALTSRGREDTKRFTIVAASLAARAVRRATTMEEFGAALTQLRAEAGLSLNSLAARFHDAGVPSLTKSTLSRSCNGVTLFQTEDQVVAFVTECGETDATEWVAAWDRARADRRAREHQPTSTEHTGAPSPAMPGPELACPADEVLGEFHVRFTRGHLQAAIMLGAIAGLAATGAPSQGVRNAGAVVLGLAAGLALLEQIRASAAPTSPPLAGAA